MCNPVVDPFSNIGRALDFIPRTIKQKKRNIYNFDSYNHVVLILTLHSAKHVRIRQKEVFLEILKKLNTKL